MHGDVECDGIPCLPNNKIKNKKKETQLIEDICMISVKIIQIYTN